MPDLKRCPSCGIDKPLAAFFVRRASPDGRQSTCKTCMKDRDASPESFQPTPIVFRPRPKGGLLLAGYAPGEPEE
jgi:hypothetical protein